MGNRAERRRRGVEGKAKTYNYNQDQLNVLIKEGMAEELNRVRKEVAEYTASRVIAVLSEVLVDEFGFGHKRLQRFIDRANKKFEALDQGYATIDEVYENIIKQTGINIKEA
jgi:hypothetical protein